MNTATCDACARAFPAHLINQPPYLVLDVQPQGPKPLKLLCGPCWLGISNAIAIAQGMEPLRTFKDPEQRALLEETQALIRKELLHEPHPAT